ncbi:suppressor of fused domain protein [Cellulophaga sp. E16_2]|uniref:suppressor of fused domain protein n=1 Tax=unclassified Cellulophaga TaxID=2634405 RepID=UPI0013FD3CFE|nr:MULTISPECIES: suppressor of fused domain protein [unclassified Cellulophaga]MBO0592501.1 suppressor of fused domain protein [Cellulophaga sp. E16_2]
MNLENYKKQFTQDDAVGWDCIDATLEKIYPEQEPKHFASTLPYALGGEEPLDGISIYVSEKQTDHFHFVTYGFSELYYNEESVGEEFSKFGFELSFRLKKESEDDAIGWACNLLQNIAKYVFKSGKWFEEFHFIPTNGPIRANFDTAITALAFVLDPEIGTLKTPHGDVLFLQMFGLTTNEYNLLKENPKTTAIKKMLENLKRTNQLLITDLKRT